MTQSFAFVRRQVGRARATAKAALAASSGQLALKALAPDMLAQCDAFEAADLAARNAEAGVGKEVEEGERALAALRGVFDQTREVVAAKTGLTYEAASAFRTPDDLLNAAEDMEAQLESADAAWVAPLLSEFSQALESATKEHQEGALARKVEQKAALERDQAAGVMRPVLVRFRRTVRATFGGSSREYRELLDRKGRGDEADPPAGGGSTS